ncbi:peptidoglycan DD-metalloendopeptidase family protein [Ferruginibacter lapsinanis]|uniref:murein hydrolase activator EnvC family protein n=1 Tax=Ferruginibacter lapsinanis TaxID=563172 RepID=UPI001E4B8996|nr:peptidoglycan DD-metalloendopeptidase family protein [Ferruginibacter lapsinanis]UEG50239.1 peptidoglycan DD-metalloendopeptidase family protein [Ferruginibacter lapsinanis]
MLKFIIPILIIVLTAFNSAAQPPKTKEQLELERQRQEIKKEIEQTQQLRDKNKKVTKLSLADLALINRKLDLQGNVIENINRDINILDNNIYRSQRDINKLSLLLDTLKREYAKSMVYAYKNRSNSDFLNFIFSASSFNDAIKRITYLKSYRAYREMQGENILRTQQLLHGRVQDLNGTKIRKSETLQVQSKELDLLAQQQEEKNQVVSKLKAQGKELDNHIAAAKKQMAKVSAAIAVAIKRARDEAIAKAKAEAKAEADRIKKEEALAKSKAAANPTAKPVTAPVVKPKAVVKKPESVLLSSPELVTLNTSFENNKGSLPWPVERGYVMVKYGTQKLDIGVTIDNPGITIGSDIGSPVKAIFDGEVSSVSNIDNMQVVIIKHGRYFSTYSNLSGVNLSRGQSVHTGQTIGRVAANDEGVGSIDLITSTESSNMNPESWLRRR